MIALNEQSLKDRLSTKKVKKVVNAEAKKEKTLTMKFFVKMLKEEDEESSEDEDFDTSPNRLLGVGR